MSDSRLLLSSLPGLRRAGPDRDRARPAAAQSGAPGIGRISPVACAGVRLLVDLLLLEAGAALAYVADAPALRGLAAGDAAEMRAILGLAPLVLLLALWQRGAYAASGPGPGLGSFAMGWLNGSGLVILGLCAFDALSYRQAHGRVVVPPALLAFVAASGGAVLARQALWLAAWPRIAAGLARTPVAVAGTGAFAYAETLRAHGATTEVVAVMPELATAADDIVALARRGAVRAVFVAVASGEEEAALSLFAELAAFPVALRVVPDLPRLLSRSRGVSIEAGLPLLHISDPPLGSAAICLKRAEDLLLSTLLLLPAAPLMLLAGLAIRLESRGPVLFRQPRHGLSGAEIEVFKFRTMYADCEDRLASRQTSRGDPRVTRVGAFLRRHSLDELPQLFNVLAGTMSLVGPRPHAPETTAAGQRLELAIADYRRRYRVKPGITGWAQVSGCRGNLDTLEKAVQRVERDLYYIEHWSLLLDLWIVARTIRSVLHDKEAF